MIELPPSLRLHGIYDESGAHLGGVYEPLMVDGQVTEAYIDCLSLRPSARLICGPTCDEPLRDLGLVWMMPAETELLVVWPAILPHVVQMLDAGASISLHAITEDNINAVCAAVSPLLGGWHA